MNLNVGSRDGAVSERSPSTNVARRLKWAEFVGSLLWRAFLKSPENLSDPISIFGHP